MPQNALGNTWNKSVRHMIARSASIVRTCIRPPHSPTLSSGANKPGTLAANSITSHGRLYASNCALDCDGQAKLARAIREAGVFPLVSACLRATNGHFY